MRNCSTVRLGDCSLAKNPLTGTDAQKLLHKSERRKFQDELRHLLDHKTVGGWKTKFKVHFAQCWRAYERDFAK